MEHPMTEVDRLPFTPDEIAVIGERLHGWEQASASQLAAIFGTTVQRISAIVHSNRPDQ